MATTSSDEQTPHAPERLLAQKWLDFLNQQDQPLSIYIGLSGGLDSSVLLHSLKKVVSKAPHLCHSIHAVHVNHQLQTASAAWVAHCQLFCQQLDIPLSVKNVSIQAAGKA